MKKKSLIYLFMLPIIVIMVACENGKEPVNNSANGHEYVDLGLSVYWATCNIGANKSEDSGYYFAWGETEAKASYKWSTYKYCKGDENNMIKYCTSSKYGTVDNKTTLELSDDAANVNWGGNWRMPSKEDIEELYNGCTWTWTNKNGVYGYNIQSKKNGNSIFLPAAVERDDTIVDFGEIYGSYWVNSLDVNYSQHAHGLSFYSKEIECKFSWYRYCGLPIRPVLTK